MLKKIVITGADGFIGSHLSKYLVNNNFEIYAIVIPDSPIKNKIENIDGINIIKGNLADYEILAEQLPNEPEAFLHFAWAGVDSKSRKSIDIQKMNLEISLNAVKLAAKIKALKFIFPGSILEYIYSGKIINRHTVPSPQDAYGATKIATRYICEILCNQLDISFIYVVISGIYASDRNDRNVINYSITKLLHKEKPSLTEMKQLWDYVHIDDVTYALERVILFGNQNGFYVIGHGDNWPLSNYIYKIRNIIDSSLPLGIGDIEYNDGKIPMACVDLTEIYEDTGFKPQISFEKGIVDVIDKIKKREGLL